jgi:hypothetical protein
VQQPVRRELHVRRPAEQRTIVNIKDHARAEAHAKLTWIAPRGFSLCSKIANPRPHLVGRKVGRWAATDGEPAVRELRRPPERTTGVAANPRWADAESESVSDDTAE